MTRHAEQRVLTFLLSLAIGGVVVTLLIASDVAEAWAIVVGWLAFFVTGWALARR